MADMADDNSDFVRKLLKMVMDATPEFSKEQAERIEQQIRKEWGGEQVKISKRAPLLKAAKEKARAEIGIKSFDEVRNGAGVSRATLYRWIGKKKST